MTVPLPATLRLRSRSKTVATWLAFIGGAIGLHRFYLYGFRDAWGWLFTAPTMVGLYGVQRMRHLGSDDHLAWVLIPLLGLALSVAMLSAIVYGLTPDETWNRRYPPNGGPPQQTGWATVIGIAGALIVGGIVLMATIAFGAQRYFEYQAELPLTGQK